MSYIAFLDLYFWYLVLLVFGFIGIWSYWYSILLVFGLIGICSYWYLVLLVFGLIGGFSKGKHKFHGVGSPPGGILKKRQPAKPRMSLFENGLLSNFDTGFRIYVKNWLYWYQGHLRRSFLRRAVTHQS